MLEVGLVEVPEGLGGEGELLELLLVHGGLLLVRGIAIGETDRLSAMLR
jgi:hypothetical protein